MRYLLLSDVHANVFALEAVIKAAGQLIFDQAIFLGDLFGYYPWVQETWDLWNRWNVSKFELLGNHDLMVLSGGPEEIAPYEPAISAAREQLPMDGLDHLRSLKSSGTLQGISCFHGSPVDPLNGRAYPDTPVAEYMSRSLASDCIIMGHTHYPMLNLCEETLIVNPGSVGQPRDNDSRASCAILDTSNARVQFYRIDYDVSGAMAALWRMNWPQAFVLSLDNSLRVRYRQD